MVIITVVLLLLSDAGMAKLPRSGCVSNSQLQRAAAYILNVVINVCCSVLRERDSG